MVGNFPELLFYPYRKQLPKLFTERFFLFLSIYVNKWISKILLCFCFDPLIISFGFLYIFLFCLSFQVTWIRHRDLHLLTVDKTTYTSDQRFVSVNNPQIGDWSLQVSINNGMSTKGNWKNFFFLKRKKKSLKSIYLLHTTHVLCIIATLNISMKL